MHGFQMLVIATKLVHAHGGTHGWAEFWLQCYPKNGVLTPGIILATTFRPYFVLRYTVYSYM